MCYIIMEDSLKTKCGYGDGGMPRRANENESTKHWSLESVTRHLRAIFTSAFCDKHHNYNQLLFIMFNCSCTISFLFFLVHIHVCSMMLYCYYNQLYSSWANPLKTPNIQNLNFHLNSFHLQRFQNLNFHPLMPIQFA